MKGSDPLSVNDADFVRAPRRRGLTPLLRPASIAVVGATERPGSYGGEALLNLARLGYPGRVYAVNPRRPRVHGVPAFPSLEDLPEAPDAVVVAIPAADAPEVVATASAIGCGGAVVFAAGFAEAREDELQTALAAAAGGLPVCGPNANGIVSLPDRVALWGDAIEPREPGPVALISQSGNVAVNALASRRGLRLHTVVSCGNQAVLDATDFLEALCERDGIRSVALYLEADGDGARWCAALEKAAAAGIGVAVLKAGRSRAGAAAATAHTGALAGDQRVFRALLEELGAAWAEDPHDLLELAKALAARSRLERRGAVAPAGDGPARRGAVAPAGVAVMTCSGGDSAVAADLAAELGVELPALAARTLARLTAVLPGAATAGNPLDYTALLWDEPGKLTELIEALGDDPAIARVLVLYDAANDAEDWAAVLQAVKQARGDVTVASTLPELVTEGAIAGLRSGIRAMRPLREPRALAARADGGRMIGEVEAKRLLREAGVPVVDGELTDDAVATWRRLGGAVAVKRVGVAHKAREGGVLLDLDDEEAIRAAAERLGPTVLVERMAPRGTEAIVAIRRDGLVPVLVVGAGGIHTERFNDVAVVPLPAGADRIAEALATLRTPIPARPIAEIALALQDLPHALIELNPVIVHGASAVVVDALAQEAS
jgi:acetate---CoA ligase (ADP-forming)